MPRPRTDADPETPKVLEKALRVLEAFGATASEWTEADLRRELGIPSSTLNRIVRTLERAGYLLRDDSGRYRLGTAAIRLGHRAGISLNLPVVLQPQLDALARETEELGMLAVPEFPTGLARYVALSESSHRLRVTAEIGTAVPMTAGATAKAILAFQPESQIEAVLRRKVEPFAAGTITDPAVMRRQLAEIRERGWAFSWEETYDGAWAVAAPLLDDENQAFAAIGVAAPTRRHSAEVEERLRRAVLDAAAQAARMLGTTAGNGGPPTA